jgi:hypothetical protein
VVSFAFGGQCYDMAGRAAFWRKLSSLILGGGSHDRRAVQLGFWVPTHICYVTEQRHGKTLSIRPFRGPF